MSDGISTPWWTSPFAAGAVIGFAVGLTFALVSAAVRARRRFRVCVVALCGDPEAVRRGGETLCKAASGWARLRADTFLVVLPSVLGGDVVRPESLRNFLGREPGLEVAVMRLDGAWSACGHRDLVGWLRSVSEFF